MALKRPAGNTANTNTNKEKGKMPVTIEIGGINIVGFKTAKETGKRVVLNPNDEKEKQKYLITFACNDKRKDVSDENRLQTTYFDVSITYKQLETLSSEIGLKFDEYKGAFVKLRARFNPAGLDKDKASILTFVDIDVWENAEEEGQKGSFTGYLLAGLALEKAQAQAQESAPKKTTKSTKSTKKTEEPVEEAPVEETETEEVPETFDADDDDEDMPF